MRAEKEGIEALKRMEMAQEEDKSTKESTPNSDTSYESTDKFEDEEEQPARKKQKTLGK